MNATISILRDKELYEESLLDWDICDVYSQLSQKNTASLVWDSVQASED